MEKGYKVIRIITVAPVLALIMAGLVAGNCEGVFPSPWHLAYSMFFLGILPLLAYPLQQYIPAYKDKGREGQCWSLIKDSISGSAAMPAALWRRLRFSADFG